MIFKVKILVVKIWKLKYLRKPIKKWGSSSIMGEYHFFKKGQKNILYDYEKI